MFGHPFGTPIATGALSHLKPGMAAFAEGAKLAGAPCFLGMGDCGELEQVLATGAGVIKKTLRAFTAELRAMMVRTGTSDLAHMDPTVIHLA